MQEATGATINLDAENSFLASTEGTGIAMPPNRAGSDSSILSADSSEQEWPLSAGSSLVVMAASRRSKRFAGQDRTRKWYRHLDTRPFTNTSYAACG